MQAYVRNGFVEEEKKVFFKLNDKECCEIYQIPKLTNNEPVQ